MKIKLKVKVNMSPLVAFSAGLVGCVIVLVYIYTALQVSISTVMPKEMRVYLPPTAAYPHTAGVITPTISAQAAMVLDVDSHVVVYAKNPSFQFSPASTTKIMTALVGLDYFKPDDVLTIKTIDTEGSQLGFIQGQKLTFKSLLYAMFLPSANDAAENIAANYPGGIPAFVNKMNEKAQTLRLYHTHFADPAGLLDDEDYTTPHDLLELASVAIRHPLLSQIMSTKYATITSLDGKSYPLANLNKLLGWSGVNGVKTGHTEGAKDVLVTSLNKNGHTILIAVMKSDDRFSDTTNLITQVVNNLTYSPIPL